MDEELHQLMTERMRLVEEAYERAVEGKATSEDWTIIKYELGLQNGNCTSSKRIEFQARPSGDALGAML